MPQQAPIVRPPSLSAQVTEDLRNRILNDGMEAGEQLPSERELCNYYGVSRTVIREAIKVLTAKGLVESIPGSGIVVRFSEISDVTEALQIFLRQGTSLDYVNLHEVRVALEVAAAGKAAEVADAKTAGQLLELCDELTSLEGDIPRASRNDFRFHKAIAESTNNEFMVLMFDVLEGALMETRVATFAMEPSRIQRVAKAHRAIARAIEARDPEAARQAMLDHLVEVKATWDQHPEYLTSSTHASEE